MAAAERRLGRIGRQLRPVASPRPAAFPAAFVPLDIRAPAALQDPPSAQGGDGEAAPLGRLARGEIPAIIVRGAVSAGGCERAIGRLHELGHITPDMRQFIPGTTSGPPPQTV